MIYFDIIVLLFLRRLNVCIFLFYDDTGETFGEDNNKPMYNDRSRHKCEITIHRHLNYKIS